MGNNDPKARIPIMFRLQTHVLFSKFFCIDSYDSETVIRPFHYFYLHSVEPFELWKFHKLYRKMAHSLSMNQKMQVIMYFVFFGLLGNSRYFSELSTFNQSQNNFTRVMRLVGFPDFTSYSLMHST